MALDSRKGLRKDRAEPDRGSLKGTRWLSYEKLGLPWKGPTRETKARKQPCMLC